MSIMLDKPEIKHIISMMDFLNIDDFVIPYFSLRLPIEANGDNYRSEKVFKFNRRNGSMTYFGSGSSHLDDIIIRGIQINDAWISRAFNFLSMEIDVKLKKKVEGECMNDLRMLLMKFNKIDFCK
jgi:hypothetical protein